MSQGTHPIFVGHMELSTPAGVETVGPQAHVRYEEARILVRLHGVPLGFIELSLPDGQVDPAMVRQEASRKLGGSIQRHLMRDGLSATEKVGPEEPPGKENCRDAAESSWHEPLTVVVCSRDRPDQLALCLPALQQLLYDAFEVVLVDNAPSSDESAKHFRIPGGRRSALPLRGGAAAGAVPGSQPRPG